MFSETQPSHSPLLASLTCYENQSTELDKSIQELLERSPDKIINP